MQSLPATNPYPSSTMATTPTTRLQPLPPLNSPLSPTTLRRLQAFKDLQHRHILSYALNHPSYHSGLFRGLIDKYTPHQTTLALLLALPHISEEEKRTVIEPLQRSIDDPRAEEKIGLIRRLVGPLAEGWRMEITEEMAREVGYQPLEELVRETGWVRERMREAVTLGLIPGDGGDVVGSRVHKGSGDMLVTGMEAEGKEERMATAANDDVESQSQSEKAEEPEQQVPQSSKAATDHAEYGPDFTEHIRKSGFRF